jgi:hypothetical protein
MLGTTQNGGELKKERESFYLITTPYPSKISAKMSA